jgi:hypothetical protein
MMLVLEEDMTKVPLPFTGISLQEINDGSNISKTDIHLSPV